MTYLTCSFNKQNASNGKHKTPVRKGSCEFKHTCKDEEKVKPVSRCPSSFDEEKSKRGNKIKTPNSSKTKLCGAYPNKNGGENWNPTFRSYDKWCDCRNLPTYVVDGKKVVCIPNEKMLKCKGRNVCVRPGPILPRNELNIPNEALQSDTTYKIDYPGKCVIPPGPIIPPSGMAKYQGPMSSDTTQRIDYQPKPHSKREAILPSNEMSRSNEPMQGVTTTMSSYKVPQGFVPSTSFRPVHPCRGPLIPMEDETTHKADYVPWNCRGPVGPFPWTPGNKYTHPCIPMDGHTTYKTSYIPKCGEGRLPPFEPKKGTAFYDKTFPSNYNTTYTDDYLGNAGYCKRDEIRGKDNMHLSNKKFEDGTTYKIDYPGWCGDPARPIFPVSQRHVGEGPMSSVTTQRADYQAKPHSKREAIFPSNEMHRSTEPMQGVTTTMSSYKVPQGFVPSASFRPVHPCRGPLIPMEDETTHKADYVPWNCRGPVGPFPWTPGNKYTHPCIPMGGDTTYRTSYIPPGHPGRVMPILPRGQGIGIDGRGFDDCTTYKNDYLIWEMVNEKDCLELLGKNAGGEPPCEPARQSLCYKVDDVCPCKPENVAKKSSCKRDDTPVISVPSIPHRRYGC